MSQPPEGPTGPVLADPTVVPLHPDRSSAAPLGPQPELVALLERCLEDARSGKAIGGIVILLGNDGACYSNSAGAFTYAAAIAQLELFKTQLTFQCLQSNGSISFFPPPVR